MADIRFKRLEITILSFDPSRVDVHWVLESTILPLQNYQFIIERSENKDFGYTHLQTVPGTTQRFVDYTTELHSNQRDFYYKVTAKNIRNNTIVGQIVNTWDNIPDLKTMEMIRLLDFLLDDRTGTPCFLFTQISDGPQCPVCWDMAASRSMDPDCPTCKGTGKFGGYYDALYTLIDFSPDSKIVEHTNWGESQPNQIDILLSSYPPIKPRDIFKKAVNNTTYIIENVKLINEPGSSMIVHQMARATEMNRSDIETKLSVPDNIRIMAVNKLMERKQKREW